MQARKLLATVMVALSITASAATTARATTNDDEFVTVLVQNNNLRAVTVYAVTSDGRLKKLGRVGSAETEAIDVPISLLQDGSKLQLKVFHPTGSGGRLVSSLSIENPGIKTSAFVVEPGAVIGLWIDADLSASLVFLQ
ncbi:MAG: hypothetical protein IIA55_12185 [Gemmatimonadetes bacterium]|nr:hypothetical protein [Gemmatimonadota bacterium]